MVAQDVVLSLAREHLDGMAGVFVGPDIPERKLARARAAHAGHVEAREPIVVLFDATLLGSGEDGFLATPERFAWKNLMEHPRAVRWGDLARTPVHALGRRVEIARGLVPVPWVHDGAERVRDFLIACGRRTRALAAPYRDVVRDREPRTLADRIVATARRALGELDWVHYRPSIPAKMLEAVRLIHARSLAPGEEVLVLYDDTVLGSGNDGLLLTERRVCWRNFWSTAEAMDWVDVAPDQIAVDGDLLALDGDPGRASRSRIDLRMRPGMARVVGGVLREIALAAQAQAAVAGLARR